MTNQTLRRFLQFLTCMTCSMLRIAFATDYNMDFVCPCARSGAFGNNLGWDGVAFEFGQQGNYTITDSYILTSHGGVQYGNNSFLFQGDAPDVNVPDDKLSWKGNGVQIYEGDPVHLGFSTVESRVRFNRVLLLFRDASMLPPTWQPAMCFVNPMGLFIVVHTDGKSIEFDNNAPTNQFLPSTPICVSQASVEYYSKHQSLKSLNAHTHRDPIRREPLKVPDAPIAPGASLIANFDPPKNAKYAVFVYNTELSVCESNRVWVSRSWAEFPLSDTK